MDLQTSAQIAEVVAAAGVIISILYLAAQVRQANVVGRGQSRQAWVALTQTELHRAVDHPAIFEAMVADEPSRADQIRLMHWLLASLRRMEFEWLEQRDGLVDRTQGEAYASAIPVILGTPRTRKMWLGLRVAFAPEFADHVDQVLATAPLMVDSWFAIPDSA